MTVDNTPELKVQVSFSYIILYVVRLSVNFLHFNILILRQKEIKFIHLKNHTLHHWEMTAKYILD